MRPLHPGFRRRAKLVAVLFLFSSLSASARLGENEAELAARFGEPNLRSHHSIIAQGKFVPLGPALTYKQDDWLIQADLVDGRCARIHYSKPGDWTEEQFKTVLDANAQGSRWTDKSNTKTAQFLRQWQRADGATAEWKRGSKIVLSSPAYLRAVETTQASAKADSSRKPKI